MMKLTVIGSSSRGNSYVLDNGSEALVIECGEPLIEVKKVLDFRVDRITACIVTHEHGDHARFVVDYLRARIPVYATKGTIEELIMRYDIPAYQRGMFIEVELLKKTSFGGWSIIPFEAMHDAIDPCGYLIYHEDMGTTLFATDTYYIHNRFRGLNHVMIECNYRDDIAKRNYEDGSLPKVAYKRLKRSHLSYDNCVRFLESNDLTKTNNIVLMHLSDGNSDSADFQRGIEELTGKSVYVADKGMEINFSRTPF